MALINKFLTNKFEEPYILVCTSKSQMLFSKDLLDKEGIENDLIPTPKGFGGVCTTAIKFDKKFEQKVREIIKKNNIEYEGIYSLKDKYKYNLSEIFNMNISDTLKDIVKKVEANIELNKEEIKYSLEVENMIKSI